MKTIQGRVAVVTGAGSGIGRALALALAREGAHLAISDINADGLKTTENALIDLGADVFAQTFDVADRGAFHAFRDDVLRHFEGKTHIVVNNAGVSLRATVEDVDYDDFEWLMNINFWGVVTGTKAFLPTLREMDEGHIVNISSVFGMVGVPTQAAYCASKFAVRGFTESLRQELLAENAAIGVSSVHPGGIKTDIVRNGRIRPMSRFDDSHDVVEQFDRHLAQTSADDAARVIVRAILKNQPRVLIGYDAHAIDVAQRTLPALYQSLVHRLPATNLKPRSPK
jgi:NAD(P)-dependent dehydrogenase (short-subunit alcohol dehydrogenase family)